MYWWSSEAQWPIGGLWTGRGLHLSPDWAEKEREEEKRGEGRRETVQIGVNIKAREHIKYHTNVGYLPISTFPQHFTLTF